MTVNPLSDGEPVTAPLINSIANGPALEGVLDGCAPSKGSGNWDVDVASGNVIIGGSSPSVSSQTVTLTAPSSDADLDSGEFRVDLVTINSSGTASATEGTAATDPIAPDIPASEVLVAAVLVSGDASSLTAADINNYRTIIGDSTLRWREDGNSPSTASGASDISYTLSGTYDEIMVRLHDIRGSVGTAENLFLTLDGDTGSNYTFRQSDGSAITNGSDLRLVENDVADAVSIGGDIFISGRWSNVGGVGAALTGAPTPMLISGENTNITSPLDSFTIQWASGTISGNIEVFGRDVA